MKLELGSRYVLRNGEITNRMLEGTDGAVYVASVGGALRQFNVSDGTHGDRDAPNSFIANNPEFDVVGLHPESSVAPSTKPTNPKDAVGVRKWRQFTCIPFTVLAELGVALLEGAAKYGAHNYRVAGVRASIYIDAAMGHILQWWEGEDIDADSGLSHITKAIASLTVLRDAMLNDMVTDDRPVKPNLDKLRSDLQASVDALFDKYPNMEPRNTECKE